MKEEKNENSITDNKNIESNAEKRVLVVGKLKGIKKEEKNKKGTKKTKKATTKTQSTKKTEKNKTASKKVPKEDVTANIARTNKGTIANKTRNSKDTTNTIKNSKDAIANNARTSKDTTTNTAKNSKDAIANTERTRKATTTNSKSTTAKTNKSATANKKNKTAKESGTKENEKKLSIKEKLKPLQKEKNTIKEKSKLRDRISIKDKLKALKEKGSIKEKMNQPKKEKSTINKKSNSTKKVTKTVNTKKQPSITKKAMERVDVLRVNIETDEFKIIAKNVIMFILVVALAVSLIYIGNIGKENVSNRILYSSLSKDIKLEELTNNGMQPTEAITTLKQENPEIKGWIKIDGTNIDYPLLQGKDDKYYLTHNFKNDKTRYGSIFINSECDIDNDKSNIIIYGHEMKDGQMFSDLIKYADNEYYLQHKTINITTENEKNEYEIVSVFKSKVFYQDEKNVFRFYQYYNFENEKQFNEYINNCKKLQLYDTGVDAKYGEQLVTLITCEYSTENGRMVVVAKKK